MQVSEKDAVQEDCYLFSDPMGFLFDLGHWVAFELFLT